MKTARWTLTGVLLALLGGAGLYVVWAMVRVVLAGQMGTWVLGRAAGVTSYVMMLVLVITGLVLSHPWARHLRVPTPRTRVTIHATLALFTTAFVVVHVVSLALDSYAGVGWLGAVLPMASSYRPVPVSLGVMALWAGLITGITARFAGRAVGRYWWSIHKVAAAILALVWAHSVLAGSDTSGLQSFYVATGLFVVALAVTRYAATAPSQHARSLTAKLAAETRKRERSRLRSAR